MERSTLVNINGKTIEVKIIYKNNKNMYLRVKNDLCIYITCNRLYSMKDITRFIKSNENSIVKMLERQERLNKKEEYFIYLGKKYEIVYCEEFKEIVFDGNKVYTKNEKHLGKYTRREAERIFNERFKYIFDKMNLDIKVPTLIIKNMKAKWGYYNKNRNTVCLNLNLMKYSIDDIDYVIIHELSHTVHFNHSKDFWNLVVKYKKDYKNNRKNLRE